MRKLRQPITKSSNTKLSMIQTDKLLRFELYHPEMLIKMNFQLEKMPEKDLVEKPASMKRFEYSPLLKELKAKLVLRKNTIKN